MSKSATDVVLTTEVKLSKPATEIEVCKSRIKDMVSKRVAESDEKKLRINKTRNRSCGGKKGHLNQ